MVPIGLRFRPARLLRGVRRFLSCYCCASIFAGVKAVRREELGQMLIETAVVLPTFFMLLFGIFTYSMVLFGRGNAICAANVAARYASMHSSTSLVPSTTGSVQSYAMAYLSTAPASGTTITTVYPSGNIVGGTVTVTVSVIYPTGIPFYGKNNITVVGTAQRTISR